LRGALSKRGGDLRKRTRMNFSAEPQGIDRDILFGRPLCRPAATMRTSPATRLLNLVVSARTKASLVTCTVDNPTQASQRSVAIETNAKAATTATTGNARCCRAADDVAFAADFGSISVTVIIPCPSIHKNHPKMPRCTRFQRSIRRASNCKDDQDHSVLHTSLHWRCRSRRIHFEHWRS
jgi:hypothetical protein